MVRGIGVEYVFVMLRNGCGDAGIFGSDCAAGGRYLSGV